MDTSITIEQFQMLLSSENKDNPLLNALRSLMVLEDPQKVMAATASAPLLLWGWH